MRATGHPGPTARLKNRTAPEVERAVVDLAIEQAAWGQVRVSEALKRQGLSISPAGVPSRVRSWAEADDGRPVYMFNLIHFLPQFRTFPGAPEFKGTPKEANAYYDKEHHVARRIRLSGRRLANLTPAEIAAMPPNASGNPTSQSTSPAPA